MNAIYTVIEDGRESFFSSKTAGGYSYPFLAYGSAKKMANALNESGFMGKVSASEMLPLMKADEHFPESVCGEKLFFHISESVFCDRETEMSFNDFTPFKITLDFDERTIGFVFNQNCPDLPRSKINIFIGNKDAANFVDGIPCTIKDLESLYQIEVAAHILERPVFTIRIVSNTTCETGSALLPLDYRNQKELANELETDNLDKCEIILIDAYGPEFKVPQLEKQPFSKLNKLAEELNQLRLDCGDNAFNSFVRANKIAPFHDADSALEAVESLRKNCALQETQGMNMGM